MGFDTTTHITIVYDCENLMVFFMIIKLTSIVVVEPIAIVALRLGVFGCLASYEEDASWFLKVELHLFKRTHMLIVPFNLLVWLAKHEKRFPNIAFLACQFMGIVGSHIKIEKVFSMAMVIISFFKCQFGIDNLDIWVLIMKNWPNQDPTSRYSNASQFKSIKEYLEIENCLVEENEKMITNSNSFEEY